MPSRKGKWKKDFEKHGTDWNDSGEPGEPSKRNQGGRQRLSPGPEGSQGACGTAANKNPGDNFGKPSQPGRGRGRGGSRNRGKGQGTSPNGRGISSGDNFGQPTQAQRGRGRGALRNHANGRGMPSGDNFGQPTQAQRGRGRGALRNHANGRGMPSAYKSQEGRPGKASANFRNQNSNTLPHPRRVVSGKSNILHLKELKEKEAVEVVCRLNEGMARLKFLLRSQEEQHNSDEFISDLICTLAVACRAPSGENTNKILAALKGSVLLTLKLPRLLDRVQVSVGLNDNESRRKFIECLVVIFTKYLAHLPSSYADLPYVQLKLALDQSSIDRKEELQKELDAFKQARNDVIRAERQKHGKRYINRMGEKPPNDFREIPICPTNKEITTHERPFLRKNITKGRYENAEHYLDVQFRLLREDFLEPLREGIHEIVQNIPRPKRKQLMKNYRNVRITKKKFTWSGIVHRVQIDVSGVDTRKWAHSKRLIYGSFVCLSKDNFKTMLFATVADRNPDDLKRGKIEIRFIEEQNVLGIESSKCVYQMVESPAYFEAYKHVLKGLKELDETTLPFKKYLVDCTGDVDPPDYLRRHDAQDEPVCYDLSKALDVWGVPNATAVPVLDPRAWPSVKELPLNNSQLEALRTAITTEFSVIQGPPGTGKTYVGAKIVRCLLENQNAWNPERNSPMLMVCYTNHALDQFLEKVLEFLPSRKIIRVGGRSRSEKLEACNLKKFTYRYKMYEERKEVEGNITQNDAEIKKCKACLEKADTQLLEFNDLEELLHSEHAEQLYNAKFPSNVENECRNPANTFTLWLCANKELNSCNQSTKVANKNQFEKHRNPEGTSLDKISPNNERQLSYDAVLSIALHDADETDDNSHKQAREDAENCKHLEDPPKAEDASKMMAKNCPEPKHQSSDQQEWNESSRYSTLPKKLICAEGETLAYQPSSFAPTGSFDGETYSEFSFSKMSGEMEGANNIGENEAPPPENEQTGTNVDELNAADDENIAIEREADLLQYQRRIQGDEELLIAISEDICEETNGNCVKEENEQARRKEAGTNVVILRTSFRRKGEVPPLFWQPEENENAKEGSVGEMVKTAENRTTKVLIVGDISNLKREDLEKEKMMSSEEVMSVNNLWNLSQSDRFRLYLFWVENYRERHRAEIQRYEQKYKELCEELEAVRFQEEERVIRRGTVVGMTTSGAARYHSMLQRVAPRIVIIEEAAEVMEAHIITSLSHNTKHTILIGDHKQLRPKATVYELAQKYNLEVSLFERMVTNNMECKRLAIQHRMRPDIAALTKRIYDHEIIDHESVCHFEDISGVRHNLFFIEHCQPEHIVGGLQSYANQHEAEFLAALCNYLVLQGYEKGQITILTMYTGQLLFLQEHMPKRKFEGVKVCAVDNFQGEENDIILLSLVRSNSEGRIGFLGESNRICVALSRARKGLYCIGNFSLLKSQSKLWKEICDDLKGKNAMADHLQLVCKNHKNVTIVKKASDFNALGGCNKPCQVRLQCGHACDQQCHASSHPEGRCDKLCLYRCPNEHQCLCRCHYPEECPICLRKMLKKIPYCGHEQQIPCYVDPTEFFCPMKCEKILPCCHNCPNECGDECITECEVNCIKTLPCGHKKCLPCYKDPMAYSECNDKCTKRLECGHPCSKTCREICQCDTKVDIQLPCEHVKRVLCREKEYPIQCLEKCQRKLDCGHDCSGICNEDCRMKQCLIKVDKVLPCGHQQTVQCFQKPELAFCNAPCQRQLDCGHMCSSKCGRLCHEVQCEELCRTKCERGHSCQKRCHYGSGCGDCPTEVQMTIPACGHTVQKPCYIDPAALKCELPCEKVRHCGHACNEICGNDCEARPCKVRVTKILPCDHVVSLECYENAEKFICKENVEVKLPCGHETSLECHVAKAGLETIMCKMQVEKKLSCNHTLILPCFQNPEACSCKKPVDVTLPCGHETSVLCFTVTAALSHVSCTVHVSRTLPCKHEATLPCHMKPEEYCCEEKVVLALSCGHNKLTTCSRLQNKLEDLVCSFRLTRKLLCGHEIEMRCSDDPSKAFCDATCERVLSCGHLCPNKCGYDCTSFKCTMVVKKSLSCGYHKISCLCSKDVSNLTCPNMCKRKLKCGHYCPGKCPEDCGQYTCKQMVVKNLSCAGNHSVKIPCNDDPNSVTCQKYCKRNLACGHPCPGLCNETCETMKCIRTVEKRFSCGHKEKLQCFQSQTATCSAPCRRRQKCKHRCNGLCGKPCSDYQCAVFVIKTFSCGHKIRMPCGISVDDVQCPAPCGAGLPCGHQCSGLCGECRERGSHEICLHPCSRLLVCLHRCKAICSEPCPPCDRECNRRCPHTKCAHPCSQPCKPCKQPCIWSCPHYQCNNPCGEECDRPRCDAPCTKTLACRHPCIGLCGENCPTLCAICHAKKLSTMPGKRNDVAAGANRYLQLFDCGHILAVEEMDAWMIRESGSDIQLLQCPRCSVAITFSFRYGSLIKRKLRSNEKVKEKINELAKEVTEACKELMGDLNHLRFDVGLMKFPRNILAVFKSWHSLRSRSGWRFHSAERLDKIQPRNIPLIFIAKNHLLIMHQVERGQLSLQRIAANQVSSKEKELVEMHQHATTIDQALGNILEYLKKPQLDLRTLYQVHEHTRVISLFASLLEAQCEAIKHKLSLSSIAETRLQLARNGFNSLLQGNSNAIQVDWLERIVVSLWTEVGLPPFSTEETKDLENFPGFNTGVWNLCTHRQVYFTRLILRGGEDVSVISNSCRDCVGREEEDEVEVEEEEEEVEEEVEEEEEEAAERMRRTSKRKKMGRWWSRGDI